VLFLLVAGAALIAAFVVGPAALLNDRYGEYDDMATLPGRVAASLVEFCRGRTSTMPSSLAELVDYWFRWHAIKVAICVPMVVVSVLLVAALWSRYLRAGRRSAVWYLAGATGSMVCAALALGVLILNIQATSVPVVALLPLVPADAGGGPAELLRAAMNNGSGEQASPAALSVLLDEVARYYWILAFLSGVSAVAGFAAGIVSWRRRATARRGRGMYAALTVVTVLTAGVMLMVFVVSTYSALTPSDALSGLLGFESGR
jgi:hypothetical protein